LGLFTIPPLMVGLRSPAQPGLFLSAEVLVTLRPPIIETHMRWTRVDNCYSGCRGNWNLSILSIL